MDGDSGGKAQHTLTSLASSHCSINEIMGGIHSGEESVIYGIGNEARTIGGSRRARA